MTKTGIDDNHVASIFASLYFNRMATKKGAHLVTTENGIEGLRLVFNNSSDRTGVMHRAVREAVPDHMIDYKREGNRDVLIIHGDVQSIARDIRGHDPEGSIFAFVDASSPGNAALKRADTDRMRAANEDPSMQHFRW